MQQKKKKKKTVSRSRQVNEKQHTGNAAVSEQAPLNLASENQKNMAQLQT